MRARKIISKLTVRACRSYSRSATCVKCSPSGSLTGVLALPSFFFCCWVKRAVPRAVSWSSGTMEMEGGGTVLLRGGAEMGSTVLVGMGVKLKETDFWGSECGERKINFKLETEEEIFF